MRLRPRFTLRWLMVAVAAAGMISAFERMLFRASRRGVPPDTPWFHTAIGMVLLHVLGLSAVIAIIVIDPPLRLPTWRRIVDRRDQSDRLPVAPDPPEPE